MVKISNKQITNQDTPTWTEFLFSFALSLLSDTGAKILMNQNPLIQNGKVYFSLSQYRLIHFTLHIQDAFINPVSNIEIIESDYSSDTGTYEVYFKVFGKAYKTVDTFEGFIEDLSNSGATNDVDEILHESSKVVSSDIVQTYSDYIVDFEFFNEKETRKDAAKNRLIKYVAYRMLRDSVSVAHLETIKIIDSQTLKKYVA